MVDKGSKMSITFRVIGIGELFMCNGNLYQKKSTRTAHMISSGRTFYMGQRDICTV
jgi:hypothetical protein